MAFSPDGTLLATASDDNTIRMWDVAGASLHVTMVSFLGGRLHLAVRWVRLVFPAPADCRAFALAVAGRFPWIRRMRVVRAGAVWERECG